MSHKIHDAEIVLRIGVALFGERANDPQRSGVVAFVMSSRRILNGINEAVGRVREGQSLAKSLEAQKMFPDLSVEMIEVGESTGALPAMLNSVAEFYEEDVQTALSAAMALIEPLILIIMAVFVGGILISLYLPIFTLGSSIH